MLAMLTSVAHADAPSGYQCGPGTPNKGVGCTCPSGYVAKRGDENVAICAAVPKDDGAQDCGKLDAGVALAYAADYAADARGPFRASFGPLAVKRCQGEPWPSAVRNCFIAARTEEASFECVDKLSPSQRAAIDADAASVQPHGATLTKSAVQLTGRLAFTDRNQLHSSSDALVLDIVRALAAQPALRLEIQAHADNREANSKQATQGRADALRSRLLASGIAAERVVAKGFGADLPIAPNKTARGRADNRRLWLAISGTAQPTTPSSARAVVTDTSIELFDKVEFAFGKADIKPESNALLDEVVAILVANPGFELVEVQAHMDERGADAYNLKITDDRANAIVRYLTTKGIAPKRLLAKGYGESVPLYADHSESAWAKNRRIAFVIRTRR